MTPLRSYPPRTQIDKLEDVAGTLEELWISYNEIKTLDGLVTHRRPFPHGPFAGGCRLLPAVAGWHPPQPTTTNRPHPIHGTPHAGRDGEPNYAVHLE